MPDISLTELLNSIDVAGSGGGAGSFRVLPVPDNPRHYVGRNEAGCPCLLLGSEPGAFHAPVKLALIEVRFGGGCRIVPIGGEAREETLTSIICTSSDAQAQAYFLYVCETILRIVGATPSLNSIVEVVQRLIELFRRLARPASRSVTGLIGELCLIAFSRDIAAAVCAWRSTAVDRFDFSVGAVRLDVKATAERLRAHHLSAEQCQPPLGTVGLLASLFIEPSGGGMSVRELVASIEGRLGGRDDLVLRVQETVAETLGETLPTAMGVRFDDRLARSSLEFYDLSLIPAIRDGIPSEVSQVHFRSNLSRTVPLTTGQVAALSEVATAFLPS